MTKQEFDALPSDGKHACPECGSKCTQPYPGCGCPLSKTGYGTTHINKYHHSCEPVKKFDKIMAEYKEIASKNWEIALEEK